MRRLFLALAVGAAASCAAPEPPLPPTVVPLGELADSARPVVESSEVDVGDPSARDALWSGWGPDESFYDGNFAWGGGRRSVLRLDLVEPRALDLRLRGWSYPFGNSPPQEVRLEIDGREIGRRLLGPEPGLVQLDLPARLLHAGENFLELRYERHVEEAGQPPWAAGWDRLQLGADRADRTRPLAVPAVDRATGELVLPARTALSWTVELPAGSWLAWDGVRRQRPAKGVVGIDREGGVSAHELSPGAGRLRLTDDGGGHQLVSIDLRALGGAGALRVRGARLHLPASHAGAEPDRTVARPAMTGSRPANLVVYIIDTLRADHLGCYGYARPTSPRIDRFAAGAMLFREARAQSSWTRPAIATLLTGLYPVTHQAQSTYDQLAEENVTIGERLGPAGWQTAMFTTNGNVSARFGFRQGWDDYIYLPERRRDPEFHARADEVNRKIFHWLDDRDPARPFLLVVHTSDPHDPYTPSRAFRRKMVPAGVDATLGTRARMLELDSLSAAAADARRSDLVELYDAEIAQNDAAFGALVDELERRGLGDDTAIVLTADHGEEFLDHGRWRHGQTLYEEQLRVPMIVRLPAGQRRPERRADPVEQIDVVPTLLELAGVAPAAELPGRSLLTPPPAGAASPRSSLAWLERPNLSRASIVREEWKLVRSRGGWAPPLGSPPVELFALGSDPEERRDLARERPRHRHWLDGLLRGAFARYRSRNAPQTTTIDPELEANLRALGYL